MRGARQIIIVLLVVGACTGGAEGERDPALDAWLDDVAPSQRAVEDLLSSAPEHFGGPAGTAFCETGLGVISRHRAAFESAPDSDLSRHYRDAMDSFTEGFLACSLGDLGRVPDLIDEATAATAQADDRLRELLA